MDNAKNEFFNRTSKSIPEIKRALAQALRQFWRCDPPEHEENITYAKLGAIFQAYVMNEEDAGYDDYMGTLTNKCKDSCPNRTHARDLCRSNYCKTHGNQCTGFVRDCKSPKSKLKNICLADKTTNRRFEYIEFKSENEVLGKKKSCSKDKEVKVNDKIHYFAKCEYCFCTCESIDSDVDRYFNLRNVTADVHNNKIVTGVRFVKKNNIFHIQVQQGQLLKNGNIKGSTVEWKPIDNYTVYDKNVIVGRDYHKITWDERSIHLDNLDSPLNNVLTGLRLGLERHHLKMEIQVTPFNFNTGELNVTESEWIKNSNDENRTELKLDDLDLPTSSFLNLPDSNNNQYIKFTTSSLKEDVGQTVVPFIDLQEMTSSPPVPISGAGLIHKGEQNSAGFLALKLYTYNFAPYL